MSQNIRISFDFTVFQKVFFFFLTFYLRRCCFKDGHREGFRGCLFKSSFEMGVLFEIMFPLKPTIRHIFIFWDFESFGMESVHVFGTVLIKCVFTLPANYWVHIWYILLYSYMILK